MNPSLIRYPIQQWAQVVNDLSAACARWTQPTGAGPFYARLHHERARSYRGRHSEPDLSYAFGSVGDVHVQLIQQHCDTPSAYRDLRRKIFASWNEEHARRDGKTDPIRTL